MVLAGMGKGGSFGELRPADSGTIHTSNCRHNSFTNIHLYSSGETPVFSLIPPGDGPAAGG